MKLFLDDVRNPPPGWTIIREPRLFFETLKQLGNKVEAISLDHDLGCIENDREITGYTVLTWIETYWGGIHPPFEIYIHSANPVGCARMQAVIETMRRRL